MCIQDISSIVTSATTLIGVLAVVVTAMITLCTYRQNTAIKRLEFIDKLYDQIDNSNCYNLLLKNDKLEIIPESEIAISLEKVLTSFDKVCNYYEQNIIDEKSLSYIACEILDLYNNPSVRNYIHKVNEKHINSKYDKDINLYSGFLWLGEHLSKYINRK